MLHLGEIIDSHYTTVHDPDLPGRADIFPFLRDLAHVAGWEPCNLRDLTHLSWAGSVP